MGLGLELGLDARRVLAGRGLCFHAGFAEVSLTLVLSDLFDLLEELVIEVVSLLLPALVRDGASGLVAMRAVGELTSRVGVLDRVSNLRETHRELFGVETLERGIAESRRVGEETADVQREETDVTRRVSSSSTSRAHTLDRL